MSPSKGIDRHLRSGKAREAYDALLDRLLTNRLVPGQILNRREVAEELGMSVSPVLEAMLQLEMEGFLRSIARKGTQVSPVRRESVIGNLVLREAIECEAARFSCGPMLAANRDRLLSLARKLDETPTDILIHWQVEVEFHRELVRLSGIETLVHEFDRCIKLYTFYGANKLLNTGPRGRRSHVDLLDQLCAADPETAARIIREHVRSGKEPLVADLP